MLQVESADSQVQSYPYKNIRDTYVTLGWIWISTDAFLALHVNVKLSEFLLLRLHNCSCDVSYIGSILFAKVNFTHVRT